MGALWVYWFAEVFDAGRSWVEGRVIDATVSDMRHASVLSRWAGLGFAAAVELG